MSGRTGVPSGTPTADKARLRSAGISQEAVAVEAGVTREMVCMVVNGHKKSERVASAIQRLYARKLDELVAS